MKTSSGIFLCLLIFVAGLAVGFPVGYWQNQHQTQVADSERLLEKNDAYYWYYRNVWLPSYLAEHHVRGGRPNTSLEPTGVGGGSSAPRPTSQPASGSVLGR